MERYIRLLGLCIILVLGLVNPAKATEIANSFEFPVPDYDVSGYSFGETVYSGVLHLGEDVTALPLDPIYASANGRILPAPITGWHASYGYVVVIEHELPNGDIVYSVSGHMRSEGLMTSGDVSQGDVIGYAGYDYENGDGGPHLHFAIYHGPYSGSWVFYGRGANTNNWYNPTDFIEDHQIPTDAYDAIVSKADELWNIRPANSSLMCGDRVSGLICEEPPGGNIHWYDGMTALNRSFIIEDWTGGTWGWVALTFDPANVDQDRAYVLRHSFWTTFRNNGGPDVFGAPIGDELDMTREDEYDAYDPYCTPRYGPNHPEDCIEEFCGPTSSYSSMQRFSDDAHGTLCWNTDYGYACEPGINCPEDIPRTPSAGSGVPMNPPTTLNPANWWYSSLDLTSQASVDYIDPLTNPHGYVNPDTGQYRIVFTGMDGNIYQDTSDQDGQAWTWTSSRISDYYWVPYVWDGISTTPIYNPLTGDEEAIFTGTDCNLWTITSDGVTGGITSSNLAALAWLPCASGTVDPNGYIDSTTGNFHVIYADTSQHVQLLIRNSTASALSRQDLSGVSGWSVYPGTSPQTFMDTLTGIHYVLFTGQDRRVKLLLSNDTTDWNAIDLTSLAPVDYTLASPMGFIHPSTGRFHAYLMGQDRRVYELRYDSTGWHADDLTSLAPVPYGDYGTGLSAVANPLTGDILVTFQGENHRIHRFRYRNNAWTATDLTSQISVEYAYAGTTPQVFVDPYTGAETTLFTGHNARIQVIRFGPAFPSAAPPPPPPPVPGPTQTDQYLFMDVNNDGMDDPCVRQGTHFYCDQDLDGNHDRFFIYGSSGEQYFSNGSGVTTNYGDDLWYSDFTSDGVADSTCSYGDGVTETQRLVWDHTILLRWGNALYLDRDMNGFTDNQFSWGAGTETYHLADMNGDGNVDVLRQSGNRFYVNANNDSVTDWSFIYGAANGSDVYYFADIDGDGADDVLIQRCQVVCNWFLVLDNSAISRSCPNCANYNTDDFTYGP